MENEKNDETLDVEISPLTDEDLQDSAGGSGICCSLFHCSAPEEDEEEEEEKE